MDWGNIFGNAVGEIISPTTAAYALAAIGLGVHFCLLYTSPSPRDS